MSRISFKESIKRHPHLLKVILLAYSSLLLLGLCDNIRGPLFPEILQDFSISDSKGSLFFGVSSFCGIIGAGTSQVLIQRWGEMRSLQISILSFTLGLLVMSIAPNFETLLGGVIFFGFSMGLMGVIQNMLIVNEVPNGEIKSKIISGLHSMYAASSLLAPVMVSGIALIGLSLSVWRQSFFIAATLCFLTGGMTLTWLRIKKSHHHGEGNRVESSDEKNGKNAGKNSVALGAGSRFYFATILSSYVLAEILVSSRMALYIRRELGGDLNLSSTYTGLFFVFLFCGRLLFAFWTPKVSISFQLKLSLGLSLIALLAGLWIHPLGFAISGFFMGPFYPLMILEIGRIFKSQVKEALSWAVSLSSVFIVGMHLIVGWISERFGIRWAFSLGPIFLAIAVLLLHFSKQFFRDIES